MTQVYSNHARIDERNLATGGLIAEKLRADPTLVRLAIENIHRWHALHGEASPANLEWLELLAGPIDAILELLTSRTEKAVRLRSSNPFTGVITQAERKVIFESHSARTYHQSR
jgi:hypothetical protein